MLLKSIQKHQKWRQKNDCIFSSIFIDFWLRFGTLGGPKRLQNWSQFPFKNEMKKWYFSQFPEISVIFRMFLALFIKNSIYYVIFWTFPWNADKNSSNFRRKNAKSHRKHAMKMNFIPAKSLTIFCWNFEIWAVQKYVHLVDPEKCWKMSLVSLS